MTFKREPCIETVRYAGGKLNNIDYHNERMNRTRAALFGATNFTDLRELIEIPDLLPSHVYKCRVTYELDILSVEWEQYIRRTIRTLKIVHAENIDYSFKYRQRHDLERLYSQRNQYDDVIIVRNGYLTDAYVCNIALFDGKNWVTPKNPLLRGTQRAKLLEEGTLVTAPLLLKDLPNFTNIRLFNAMMPWSEAIELPVSAIFEEAS